MAARYGDLRQRDQCGHLGRCSEVGVRKGELPLPPGGAIVFSGRSRTYTDRLTAKRRVNTGKTRDVWFLDENGITATYQRGIWLYQKFHSIDQIRELGRTYIGPKFEIVDYDGGGEKEIRASSFAVVGLKTAELPREEAESALRFEFNLPLPEGKRYGRAGDVIASFGF